MPAMKAMLLLAGISLLACEFSRPAHSQGAEPLGKTLNAAERQKFVDGVMEGCLEGQREAPENKGIPQKMIDAYCRCTAAEMVDRFSLDEMEKVGTAITPELQARVNEIEKVCVPKAR